ncbi:hypothetical protein Btru_031913 [Bulinus truncatus]|nr:hypothetical protein Btru_031913 [Bulinus truncatus]
MSPRSDWSSTVMAMEEKSMPDIAQNQIKLRPETSATASCQLPGLIAYWSPPPTWPRRVLCENSFLAFSLTRGCWLTLSAITLTYFAAMDVLLFARYLTVNMAQDSRAGQLGETYSPFTHLSVKAMLSDHVRHYVMTPTAEYFDAITGFSSAVTVATPNVISFVHLACAFVSGKLVASENLHDRQLGALLFFFRTWLDSLDGTVFRNRAGLQLQYNSVYSSSGYVIDGFLDTLGGVFLSFGVLFYLLKRRNISNGCPPLLPVYGDGKSCCLGLTRPADGQAADTRQEITSCKHVGVRVLGLGLCLSVTGVCWDRTVKGFTQVFQADLTDNTTTTLLQSYLSHTPMTLVIFFFWRLLSGQTVLTYTQIAIYMDRVWEFLHYTPWVILSVTIPLYVITVIYTQQIKEQLML